MSRIICCCAVVVLVVSCAPSGPAIATAPAWAAVVDPPVTATASAGPTPAAVVLGDEDGALWFIQGPVAAGSVKVLDPDGGAIRVIDESVGSHWRFAVSPDGSSLALVSGSPVPLRKEVYVLDARAARPRELGSGDGLVESIALSPDGSAVAFSSVQGSGETGNATIFMAPSSGAADPVPFPAQIRSPWIDRMAFSPDGAHLSFASRKYNALGNGRWEPVWFVATAEGSGLRQLDTSAHAAWQGWSTPVQEAQWRPGTQQIALNSRFKVTLDDVGTGESQTLISMAPSMGSQIMDMTWSPDGNSLAYVKYPTSYSGAPPTSIHIYSLKNQSDRRLTATGKGHGNLAWSPDGTQLAFTRCDEVCGIYRTDISSGAEAEVISGLEPQIRQLQWTPPVNLLASIIPPTPIPPEPRETLPQPPLYDDFEAKELDVQRFVVGDPKGQAEYFTWMQADGRLTIITNGSINSRDFSMRLGKPFLVLQPRALEARMRISDESSGFSFAKIAVSTLGWSTQCRLGNNLAKPSFLCDVASTQTGYSILYETLEVPVQYGKWYAVRIEIRPAEGILQFYLDGAPIDSYLVEDRDAWMGEQQYFTPWMGMWVSRGSLRADYDDVRLTK